MVKEKHKMIRFFVQFENILNYFKEGKVSINFKKAVWMTYYYIYFMFLEC